MAWRNKMNTNQVPTEAPPSFDPSPHALLVSASYDLTIRLWQLSTGKCIGTIPHNEGQVNALSLTSTGRDLAVGAWQKVRIYDVSSGKDPKATIELPKNVTVVGFEAAGRWMYTGGDDGVCRIWEMRNNQLVANRLLSFPGSTVTSIVPNTHQTHLFVSTNSAHVWVWDVVNHIFMRLPMPDDLKMQEFVQKLAVHPSGKKLTGITNKGRLLCWDLMTREVVESSAFDMFKSPIVPIEQDTGTYGCLRDEDKHYKMREGHGLSCRYSPDGKYIVASGSEKEVYVFNSETMEIKGSLQTECGWNWDAIFSSEGRYIFTGGNDNQVKIWDVENNKKVAQWDGHIKPLTAMCMNGPTPPP
ncbi:Target of rapamycin complex subunit lst8 [Caenorhabditis elegans]|uniref:Target of rapamycin complex subunit lst8 n=1 Tax=Caenorhabditis elegans TaxID=6239 RepID=E5QCF5_CAEEL|nr:Target of rapamycin complex subunit lst8 [Caenorhabditis elegans]CCD64224.1 Target of rapamycin complex subunit lst8 [Caenorhabditis elegans]|eukprot:NP_001249708.1 Mtor (MTOR) associated protein, LST8 homolog [Caenorhabditis elegans]